MISLAELEMKMAKLKGWSLEGQSLVREFDFPSFKDAVDFVNRVAEAADRKQHHPTLLLDFTRVRIYLTTKEERGISEKDFDLAADIDKIKDAIDGVTRPV